MVVIQNVFAIGDVTVVSADFVATPGTYNNESGTISPVRVDYAVEWTTLDSMQWIEPDHYPGGWDFLGALHLAWAYLDSNGPGTITPVYCDWLENASGERWECDFGECYEYTGTETLAVQTDSSDTFYLLRHATRSSGTMFLSLPQGSIRLYLIGDEFNWEEIYLRRRPAEFCGGTGCPRIDEYTNLNDYFEGNVPGDIHLLQHRDIIVPSVESAPPPAPGITFMDWIAPGDTTGKNWLPTPEDTIGLKFKLITSDPGATHRFTFVIFDISAWQGKAMNYPAPPVAAPWHTGDSLKPPRSLDGSDYDFDYWLAEPEQYEIKVVDMLVKGKSRDMFSNEGWTQFIDSLRARDLFGKPIGRSRKTIIARTRNAVTTEHTLRLVARDYAAHCLVAPFVEGNGKSNSMAYATGLGDTVNYVSVPRDEDGYYAYAYNFGDYLADAWEEKVFAGDSLRKHWPFMHPDSMGDSTVRYEDDDHFLVGRGFDGDDLLNFEEYRGFWVAADSTQPHDTLNYKHVRCEPRLKDVLVYFHPMLEADQFVYFFEDLYPGHIHALDTSLRVHYTDYNTLFGIGIDSSHAWEALKPASSNRKGATSTYPPLFIPDDTIRYSNSYSVAQLVTFWPWFPALGTFTKPYGGWMRPNSKPDFINLSDSSGIGYITTHVRHICVNFPYFERRLSQSQHYQSNLEDWEDEAGAVLKQVIAHEFGHAVGLTHPQGSESKFGMMGPIHFVSGRFVQVPDSFSQVERSRFTIRKE
jgi:hypothetical protein